MKKLVNIVFLVSILASNYVQSAPVSNAMSAKHLYAACNEAQSNKYAEGFCDGAIDALVSSIQDWCVPAEIKHLEVNAQVKNELLKSIPLASLGALEFVSRAIQKKWSCI